MRSGGGYGYGGVHLCGGLWGRELGGGDVRGQHQGAGARALIQLLHRGQLHRQEEGAQEGRRLRRPRR